LRKVVELFSVYTDGLRERFDDALIGAAAEAEATLALAGMGGRA
jgi:hypothetical protein